MGESTTNPRDTVSALYGLHRGAVVGVSSPLQPCPEVIGPRETYGELGSCRDVLRISYHKFRRGDIYVLPSKANYLEASAQRPARSTDWWISAFCGMVRQDRPDCAEVRHSPDPICRMLSAGPSVVRMRDASSLPKAFGCLRLVSSLHPFFGSSAAASRCGEGGFNVVFKCCAVIVYYGELAQHIVC